MASCFCRNLCAQDHCLLAPGHLVFFRRFQLYDARSVEPPPMPSEPKLGACQEAPLQMKDSLSPPHPPTPQIESVRCRGKRMAFLLTESERSTFKQIGRRGIGMVYISEELIQKGMSLITAVCRDFSFCQHSLLCVLHLQQVREGGKSIWHDLQWSEHVENRWRLGRNQCRRGRHMLHTCLAISHEMQPGTNWTGPAGSINRPKPAEQQGGRNGKRVRDAEGIERVVGCEVILPHRVFY